MTTTKTAMQLGADTSKLVETIAKTERSFKATKAKASKVEKTIAKTERSFKATKAKASKVEKTVEYKVDPTDTIWTRDTEDREAESAAIARMAQDDWFSSHWGGGAIVDEHGNPVGGFIFDNHPYGNEHRRPHEHKELIEQLASRHGCNVVAQSACGQNGYTLVYTFDRYVPYSEIVVDLWVDIKAKSIADDAEFSVRVMRLQAYQAPRPRSRKSTDADGRSLAAE